MKLLTQMMLLLLITSILLLKIPLISCENDEYELSEMIEINEDNWETMLTGEWMVEFFAPWCPACESLVPTWEKFAKSAGRFNVYVAKIDVTKSPSLSGRFFVMALPTIFHVFNGEFRQYRGPRNEDALIKFVQDKQWTKVEPLSSWKQPNSIHMTILSWLFKLSHNIKDINSYLYDEYGLPVWGSYILFATLTILIGAIMGLILVCVVDVIDPQKKVNRFRNKTIENDTKNTDKNVEDDKNNIEEIVEDDLEDDDVVEVLDVNDTVVDDTGDNNADEDSTSESEKKSNEDSEDNESGNEKGVENKNGNNEKDKCEEKIISNESDNSSELRERKINKIN